MAFHRYFVLEEEKEKHIENAHPRPTVQSFKFKGRGAIWLNVGFLFILE